MTAATVGTIMTIRRVRSQIMQRPVLDRKTIPTNLFQGAAMFSRLAYNEPIDVWKGISTQGQEVLLKWIEEDSPDGLKFEFIDATPLEDTQLYIWKGTSSGKIVVAFRGTLNTRDAMNALDVKLCGVAVDGNKWATTTYNLKLTEQEKDAPVSMRIHKGFLRQYLAIRKTLMEALQGHEDDEIVITGHSLGGALASLAALDLNSAGYKMVYMVTFGAPRVGDQLFAERFEAADSNCTSFRIFKDRDPIPQILMSPKYFHVGKGLLLDDWGNLRHISKDLETVLRPFLMLGSIHTTKLVTDHSTETYIDLLLEPKA